MSCSKYLVLFSFFGYFQPLSIAFLQTLTGIPVQKQSTTQCNKPTKVDQIHEYFFRSIGSFAPRADLQDTSILTAIPCSQDHLESLIGYYSTVFLLKRCPLAKFRRGITANTKTMSSYYTFGLFLIKSWLMHAAVWQLSFAVSSRFWLAAKQ